ncbi:MAG TPA: hypothetical protein PLW31_04210 [Bacteroidales bacterium]|nr:hypothetical protein [Bacteroidales bacterium]
MKHMKSGILAFLIIASYCSAAQEVGIGQWRDHLPYDYATRVEEFHSAVYCATPYSMFYFDRDDNRVQRLSKVNGLSDLGVSDISLNTDQDILVVSYSNTNVDLVMPDLTIINIPDIKRKEILGNKTINSIMNYGKFAYLSCGFGIVVLNVEKREIKDTYYIGPEGSRLNVFGMTYNDTAFFAATESGIFYAAIDDPNLAFYGNWHKIPDLPYPNGYYNLIANYGGRIIVNHADPDITGNNAYVIENGEWNLFEEAEPGRVYYNIRVSGDKLVVSYGYFVIVFNSSLEQELKIYTYGESSPMPSDAMIGTDGYYWLADRSKGLVKVWGGGFNHEFIKPSGAPTADIFDMACSGGKLYLVPGGLTSTWNNSWKGARLYSLIDETWKTYSSSNVPPLDTLRDFVSVAVDPQNSNHVFAGSWNRGMAEFNEGELVVIHNSDNSGLAPNMGLGYPNVKVGGIAFDSENNLWATSSGSEKILAVRRPGGVAAGEWEAYNLGSSTTGAEVKKVIVDSYNQKWIIPRTTQTNPNYIFVFNENNDPGKQFRGLKSGAGYGNLPGTSVYAIAEDLEGEVWVGTDEGVAVFYSPQDVLLGGNSDAELILVNIDGYTQYLLETEIVKAIAVDAANNKWIGTERAGVFLLSADGTKQIHHFTEDNSPLFSNNITSLTINGMTGEVFIGTAKGLISYKGTATDGPDPVTDSYYAYPNPVKPGYSGTIAIRGPIAGATVKITDIRGSLIYETMAEYNDTQVEWNGLDMNGRRPNTGVFLVFVSNNDGSETMVTKILFVN